MRFHFTIHFQSKNWESADKKFKRVMKLARKVIPDAMGFMTQDTRAVADHPAVRQ